MNFVEEFILFIFTILAMLTLNSRYSFGDENLKCPHEMFNEIQAQYLFIGENHFDFNSKKFFKLYSSDLKAKGFETIFVEYIESKDQKALDKFNSSSEPNREKTFRTYGLPGDWGYDPEAYLFLTDLLGSNGFEIRGLDRRSDLKITLSMDERLRLRDVHMFQVAQDFILQNPEKKIIFFNGSSHSSLDSDLKYPSFYEHFVNHFGDLKTQNIKIDYYGQSSISLERLAVSEHTIKPTCENDLLIYTPQDRSFDFYLFFDDLLPILGFPNTYIL